MAAENQTNVLDTLVGDGKKFKTIEDLAKGKLEADTFIESLQTQIATLQEEHRKATNNSDRTTILEKLMADLTNNTVKNPQNPEDSQPSDKSNQSQSLTQDDIVNLIEAREKQKQEERNLATAWAKFKEIYGDKSDETLTTVATKLGLTVDALKSLGKTSPQAFLNVVGVNSQAPAATRSMANGGSNTVVQTDGETVRNKAYYDGLKKQMGIRAFVLDSKLQVQMHKDALALGEQWG